jgi:hypothetical protein
MKNSTEALMRAKADYESKSEELLRILAYVDKEHAGYDNIVLRLDDRHLPSVHKGRFVEYLVAERTRMLASVERIDYLLSEADKALARLLTDAKMQNVKDYYI